MIILVIDNNLGKFIKKQLFAKLVDHNILLFQLVPRKRLL